MSGRNVIILLILIVLLPGSWAAAEKTGRIGGIVRNGATLEPQAGANVVVVGTRFGAATDLEGRFTVENLPVGTYAVRATVLGYKPLVLSDVVVTTARPVDLRFDLVRMEIALDDVTVTSGYFRATPDKPVSTIVQSSEEIRRLPGGFEDVLRAVSILPGVAQVSAGRNDLIIRGGGPAENLYVVDNITLPNINHYGTQGSAGGPQSYINIDYIDRVRFSTGGFGVRYGDRLSSVLSIDLREGRQDRIGGKATLSATQFGLNLEGPVSAKGNFIFSARRSYLDFIFKAADFAFVPEYWDFLVKGSYDLTPRDRLSILSITALDNVRLFNDTEDQRFDNSRILAPEQTNAVGGVTWRHLLNRGYATVTLGQSYVTYNTEQSDSLLNPIFRNQALEHESSLKTDVTWQMTDRTELSTGLEGRAIRFNADLVLDTLQNSFGETLYTDAEYDTTGYKAAAYLQVAHKFRYLRWTVGARLDYFNLIEDGFAVSPRVALSYPLTTRTNLNASFGRFYQAPAYIWLVGQAQNRNLDFIGVNQYIAGFDHLLRDDTKLTVEFYYKDYFDYPVSALRPYLILVNTGSGYGGTEEGFASFGLDPLVSAGSGWARGVELTLQKRFSERPYYGTLAVSYGDSRFQALDGVERPGSYDQRWIVNLGSGYLLGQKWEFAGKFRFATGRPYTPFNSDGTQEAAEYNSKRLDANHSLDLRVDRRWYFDRWTLTAYVDVQNVYNFIPHQPPRWNAREGRAEEPDSIGLLPTVGIAAEF